MVVKKQIEHKPTYYYVKEATLEQFFDSFKKSLIVIFWMALFIIPCGILFDDPRYSSSMWGISNFIWYLGFFAIASWLYRGQRIDIEIPRLTFIEWLAVNFIVVTLTFSHLFANRWFDIFYFLFLFFLVILYFNLLDAGKKNLEIK